MRTKSRMISVASVLAAALLAGCSNYQPYGQPGYYGFGQPAPIYNPPAGSFAVPGTMQGPATPVAPSGGGPFVPPNDPQARFPGSDGTFDPATDVGSSPDDNLVPEYDDPGDFGSSNGGGFGGSPNFEDDSRLDDFNDGPPATDDFGTDFNDDFGDDDFGSDAFGDDDFGDSTSNYPLPYDDRGGVQLDGIESVDADAFEQPLHLQPTTAPAHLQETSVRTERPNPYDYDRVRLSWIRGTIDHDEQTDTWNVIYSVRPEPRDEFGGSLTVTGRPELFRALESGDVVLAEGTVDRTTVDPLGKPVYRVDHLVALQPAE